MADVIRSLEQLHDAVDLVFGRIAERVAMEHERLHELSKRIRAAKAKVDAISGTKQAITVFSTTKYPVVSPEAMDFRPLFGDLLPAANVELAGGAWQEDENEGTLELFRFFMETSHERLNAVTRHDPMSLEVSSLADVLTSVLECKVEKPSAERESYRNPIVLPPPPQSLTRSSNTVAPGLEEFGFKPTLRQVPLFSLPSRLPDLPMVADIRWAGTRTEADELSAIAPSAVNRSPQKSTFREANKDESLQQQHTLSPSSIEISTDKRMESSPSLESRGKEKVFASPPAPPPIPPPLPSPPPASSTKSTAVLLNKPSSSSSGPPKTLSPPVDAERAALLESIRSPNVKLKKTGLVDSPEKPSQPEHPKPAQQQQQADLLAEMATTLKMRRLSMKGASHDVSKIPTSPSVHRPTIPIKNLQAFIPAAAPSSDDDDDDDDWEE